MYTLPFTALHCELLCCAMSALSITSMHEGLQMTETQ